MMRRTSQFSLGALSLKCMHKGSTNNLKSQTVTSSLVVLAERVERRILSIRGQKVMLSTDLAELYEVEPRVLVQAVQRNRKRFPADFMFQLTRSEYANLKSQFVI